MIQNILLSSVAKLSFPLDFARQLLCFTVLTSREVANDKRIRYY